MLSADRRDAWDGHPVQADRRCHRVVLRAKRKDRPRDGTGRGGDHHRGQGRSGGVRNRTAKSQTGHRRLWCRTKGGRCQDGADPAWPAGVPRTGCRRCPAIALTFSQPAGAPVPDTPSSHSSPLGQANPATADCRFADFTVSHRPDYNRKPISRATALLALPTLQVAYRVRSRPDWSINRPVSGHLDKYVKPIAAPPVDTNAVLALNDEQIQFDKTVFANEVEAQAYESTFVALWDRLR